MQQQLIENTINILPSTMDEVLEQISTILKSSQDPEILSNMVKSLFYGLWNFDKMINQHNLSTRIAGLLQTLPKKAAFRLFRGLLGYLNEKWNLIDHHRINKFMQLVRYLIRDAFALCDKFKMPLKMVDKIFLETVYQNKESRSGLGYHVIDLYYQIYAQTHPDSSIFDLGLLLTLLQTHELEHFRLHLIEKSYEKHKQAILALPDQAQSNAKIEDICSKFMEIAKSEENDLKRKNFYALIGFMRSEKISFGDYLKAKEAKAKAEKQKRKKKLTKGKRKQIFELKAKRKEKNKRIKKSKTMSVYKFEDRSRMRKAIEQL